MERTQHSGELSLSREDSVTTLNLVLRDALIYEVIDSPSNNGKNVYAIAERCTLNLSVVAATPERIAVEWQVISRGPESESPS